MIFKKIRKGHVDWRNFLCSTPARDYVFQKDAYEDQIDRAAEYIRNADCVIIGAGAGASTKIVLKDPIPMPGSKKKKMTRLIRQENVKAVDAYIDRIDEMIERKGEWLWH